MVALDRWQARLEKRTLLSLDERDRLRDGPLEGRNRDGDRLMGGRCPVGTLRINQLVRAVQVRLQCFPDVLLQRTQDPVRLVVALQVLQYLLHSEGVGVLASQIRRKEVCEHPSRHQLDVAQVLRRLRCLAPSEVEVCEAARVDGAELTKQLSALELVAWPRRGLPEEPQQGSHEAREEVRLQARYTSGRRRLLSRNQVADVLQSSPLHGLLARTLQLLHCRVEALVEECRVLALAMVGTQYLLDSQAGGLEFCPSRQ
mmetsp:Transcript_75340/g.195885  ORF Transcript_75340/g.195885 Transcript_75340/m.195885 type:complete len:258 (-) Transcript_75340:406-1179(-)